MILGRRQGKHNQKKKKKIETKLFYRVFPAKQKVGTKGGGVDGGATRQSVINGSPAGRRDGKEPKRRFSQWDVDANREKFRAGMARRIRADK